MNHQGMVLLRALLILLSCGHHKNNSRRLAFSFSFLIAHLSLSDKCYLLIVENLENADKQKKRKDNPPESQVNELIRFFPDFLVFPFHFETRAHVPETQSP